jgi:N-acetylmuramoyl-L-alanine amidase
VQKAFRRGRAAASAAPAGLGTCVCLAIVLAVLGEVFSSSARSSARASPPLRHPAVLAQTTSANGSPGSVGRGGPIQFRPDACLSFAPTAPPNAHTVFLDPGHGGPDSGAIGVVADRAVLEKQVTLGVAMRALSPLRESGYTVVLSRTGDSTVMRLHPGDVQQGLLTPDAAQREIEARDLCANAARADVLIGLHMNGFADPSARGTEDFYSPRRPFAARSERLAGLIQRAMLLALRGSGTAPVDRGVLPDSEAGGAPLTPQTADYHHLIELGPAERPWLPYPSLMPGALAEPLFVTNPIEASFAISAHGQEVLARALVGALDTYFRGAAR